MKIETQKIYTFQNGDVICNTMYFWAAVRYTDGVTEESHWKHTNPDDPTIGPLFSDEYVERVLESGTWKYMGNIHAEVEW